MPIAGPEALARLQETIRQLRGIPQVREQQPGRFDLLGQAYVRFHETEGRVHAELRKPGGTGVERFAVDTPAEQRKLIDEAKRRAAKLTDE